MPYVSFGSSVTPKIFGGCSWIMLSICRYSLVLYSAGPGVDNE